MNILFMCVANSARSQIAEGLAQQLFPEAEIKSAGSLPGKLNPYAVAVMKELDIDISKQYSKGIDDLSPKFVVGLDYIITLCAEEVCPSMVAQKAKRLHWPIPDPAIKDQLPEAEALRRFCEARDAIHARLKDFKDDIAR